MTKTKINEGLEMSQDAIEFKAKVNVNFSIPSFMFPKLREINKKIFEEMRELNPDIRSMPTALIMKTLMAGDEIVFSDKPQVTNAGEIYSYPIAIFDAFSKRYIEMPNPIKGPVQPMLEGKTLPGLPEDLKEEVIAKMKSKQLHNRFIDTPYLERIA